MQKKKIVFIMNNFLVGGVERLLFDIMSSLPKDKYDIKIVTVYGTGPLEDSFRKLGIPIYFAGLPKSLTDRFPADFSWVLSTLFIIIRVTFFLLKSKPDVVVSSLFQADVIGMTSARLAMVKKRILIHHDMVKFAEFIRKVKKNFALCFATHVIAVSEEVKIFLVEYFETDSKKVQVIFNGIDYERFVRGRKVVVSGMPVIGIVARLAEIKGHIYALEALKILKENHGILPMTLFAGDGALRPDLEKYVIDRELSNVKFLGGVDDIPDFLSGVDILIVPSISEGFCIAALEGMVAGKAIVASDLPVMHELITDGENGLFFELQNSKSLADVLLKLLGNKEMIEKIQKNAISFADKNKNLFDMQEVKKTYEKLFANF